jgi:mannose-6-phosphate isomerase-like protein (cupin superfamily)
MAKNTSRRTFLRTVPVAAAAGFTLSSTPMFAEPAQASNDVAAAAAPFKLYTAKERAADAQTLRATPGDKKLVDQAAGFPCAIVMTTEVRKSAKEFEWHEGRDHIVAIIDGSTLYEVGGTPKNGRNTKAGEWLAPASEGSKSILMGKGDMLTIPRGTPHKRSTEDSVTFMLISPYGTMKA